MIVTINMNSNIKMSRIVSVLMNICGYFFRELPKCKPMKQHAAQCCPVSSVTVSECWLQKARKMLLMKAYYLNFHFVFGIS